MVAKRKALENVDANPVPLGATGRGLPYAPEDWPNPGDVWSWRVGRRVTASGFHQDRFLYAPESLQEKSGKRVMLQSKPHVVRFLKEKVPDADIDAFWASFTWDIPGPAEDSKKGIVILGSHSGEELDGEFQVSGRTKRTRKAKSKAKNLISYEELDDEFALEQSESVAELAVASELSDNDAISQNGSEYESPIDLNSKGPQSLVESQAALDPQEFDNFLNSLDEIMSTPVNKSEASGSVTFQREGLTETRAKLSSLLTRGFSGLVTSSHFKQLTTLSSKLLQCDPTLSPTELSMLKLIQEIPLASKNFQEAEKLVSQADKFFDNLNAKISRVASLKNEYKEAKEQLDRSQAKESSAMLSMMEIDEQIAALQLRRAEVTETIKATNRQIVEQSAVQKKIMESLPKIVHEVQVANTEKEEWELKKNRSAEQVAEIKAKFAPLEGFSF
ncbi:OLC1v1020026C1 [Oldenlandia corymbosa var. corymbosa]|uniref:OLC1v1020026C1 n=1 Tax=Oldenlandia corymbosa var. corymbosa TaxID=529605 RepID=A0AAV1EFE0_OLDCO|nr:OLC1v1020026C1 [Oldenlandia corymbosa var. corymbosa]